MITDVSAQQNQTKPSSYKNPTKKHQPKGLAIHHSLQYS
jgi:hypothetical protein